MVIAAVAALVVVRHRTAAVAVHHDPISDHNFAVNGQLYNCGTSGDVALDVAIFYPGATASFTLDGDELDAVHPGGDQFEYRPTSRPTYSCADGQTHRIQVDNGHGASPFFTCQIQLTPAVQLRAGYNFADFPAYSAGEHTCDLTWTD